MSTDLRKRVAMLKSVINLVASQLYNELKNQEIESIEIVKSKDSLEILSPFYDITLKKLKNNKVKVSFRVEEEFFSFIFSKELLEEILKETKLSWLIFEIMRNAKRVNRELFENSIIESYEFI